MTDCFALQSLERRMLMASGTILFVRGADRSGGFLEAANDSQRTEQLADINNTSTASGNHGWGTLASLLRGQGYTVEQIKEPLESGAPSAGQTTGRAIRFESLDLSKYAGIVMASNNAVYGKAQVDALDQYVRNGGGVLYVSDGNFGSSWADAPSSDNQFLARYGLAFNQDGGQYALRRSAGDFVEPNNPLLIGVNAFDGEGVSPVRFVDSSVDGVTANRLVRARGTTYDNNPTSTANNSRGTQRAVDSRDSTLATVFAGAGRVAAFFDRNTFFNANGAGTDITKNDNTQLAKNLFGWLADSQPPAVVSSGFAQGSPRKLTFRLDDNLAGTFTRDDIRMRNRRTGEAIAGGNWSLSLNEGNGYTDVTISIQSSAVPGPFQLQIDRRAFADDSGNVRTGAIRYAFTILPIANSTSSAVTSSRPSIAFASFESKSVWTDLMDD
jgi:hypothetical protein